MLYHTQSLYLIPQSHINCGSGVYTTLSLNYFFTLVWLWSFYFLSVPKVVCKHLGQNDLSLLQAPAATLAEPL